ncbi:EAL-associated domain-containing protein [Methylocucumis oryzae]|uniref:EAL-associated domain-containing protein n=1 Tax=Methylocucumis oryzae TaxID=1632867 RepID=UPI001EF9DC2D|nr:EAL-associated domain-containing protein [Methylocucumis oryzae]
MNKTLVKEQEKIQFICQIKNLINQLKASVETVVELEKVPTSLFANTGLLRFYLCNNNGDQISANYNFAENQWLVDTEKLGFNWSWREYFYQLRALEVTDSCYRVVTSDRYRDFSSEVLCKTLSLRLDDNRILLVDIAADKL